MNAIAADLVQKIAKMLAVDVPHEQIAMALSIDVDDVGKIAEMDMCKDQAAAHRAAKFETQQTLNDSWDAVEALGANAVLHALQENPDPEFALRAAAQANKAQRRGVHGNRPIDGGQHGGRAVLAMPTMFIESLQQINVADGAVMGSKVPVLQQPAEPERKAINFMNPQGVEKLLRPQAAEAAEHVEAMFEPQDD